MMRDLLIEAAHDIEQAVRHEYGYPDVHPAMHWKYDRDMEIVSRLRAAADSLEAPPRPEPVAWANDLHAAASDLRFVASGGQCDPRTLLEHADALLRIAAHPSAAAGAVVVELDEWAIVDRHNVPARFRDNTDEASISRQDLDTLCPDNAPHRVMRVCLKEFHP